MSLRSDWPRTYVSSDSLNERNRLKASELDRITPRVISIWHCLQNIHVGKAIEDVTWQRGQPIVAQDSVVSESQLGHAFICRYSIWSIVFLSKSPAGKYVIKFSSKDLLRNRANLKLQYHSYNALSTVSPSNVPNRTVVIRFEANSLLGETRLMQPAISQTYSAATACWRRNSHRGRRFQW